MSFSGLLSVRVLSWRSSQERALLPPALVRKSQPLVEDAHRDRLADQDRLCATTTSAPPIAAVISQRLAAFGGGIVSPRGPYRAHPSRRLRFRPRLSEAPTSLSTSITWRGSTRGARRLRERHRPYAGLAAKRVQCFDRWRGGRQTGVLQRTVLLRIRRNVRHASVLPTTARTPPTDTAGRGSLHARHAWLPGDEGGLAWTHLAQHSVCTLN